MLERIASKGVVHFRVEDTDTEYWELSAKGVGFVDVPHLFRRDNDGLFGAAGGEGWMAFFNDLSGNLLAVAERRTGTATI